MMKTVMNEMEDTCEMKTINNFFMKYIVTVARQSPAPILYRRQHPTTFCSPRRPRSRRYSRRNSDRGFHRWGSVTMGACKGSHQYYYYWEAGCTDMHSGSRHSGRSESVTY